MLQIRLQGEQAEARAFLDALAAGGAEVAVGTTKDRGEYAHVYATVRMPGYTAAAAPADGPVRTSATLGRPVEGRRDGLSRRRR
jgi:hypothetical protein